MIRRRARKSPEGLAHLVADTQDLVAKLVRENRTLRARNERLSKEVDRLSEGWDQIKKLARRAPRERRGRG